MVTVLAPYPPSVNGTLLWRILDQLSNRRETRAGFLPHQASIKLSHLERCCRLVIWRCIFSLFAVLSWDVVIETLMDDDFMQRDNADESAMQAHLVRHRVL